jgi:hypothetical protein
MERVSFNSSRLFPGTVPLLDTFVNFSMDSELENEESLRNEIRGRLFDPETL